MAIKTRTIDGILIFDVSGDDLNFLKEDLRAVIEEASKKTTRIIINLKDVQNINSHVIGSISAVKRMLSSLKGDLVVINLSEKISNIFKVVHLDKVIKTTANEQEAVNYLKNLN
ncbi:MAG TPA: STAS domain-containing protein [Candidatus Wallbacteria bacterium]|nr:STAS domain-containing protein [Candidatus Wallbacteria bacterium]